MPTTGDSEWLTRLRLGEPAPPPDIGAIEDRANDGEAADLADRLALSLAQLLSGFACDFPTIVGLPGDGDKRRPKAEADRDPSDEQDRTLAEPPEPEGQ